MKNLYRAIHPFRCSEAGTAMIEFAFIFPILFLLLFGGLEINRLMLTEQKHEKAGYALADIITQYQPATRIGASGEISEAELTQNVFPQFARIMHPYDDEARQAVIVTSIEKTASGDAMIRWQVAGGGTLSGCDNARHRTCVQSVVNQLEPSAISPAVAGARASFPADVSASIDSYSTTSSTNIIVTEVFYFYEPILQELLQGVGRAGGDGMAGFRYFLEPKIFVKRTFFLPRSGELYYLPPAYPVP